MSVTLEELAARVQLNKGTVSRILNDTGRGYSDHTRQRVLKAAHEMEYRPNSSARAIRTGSTSMVALWLLTLDHHSEYFSYMQHFLQRVGLQHGYQLITEDVHVEPGQETEYTQLARWPVDGIIACYVPVLASRYMLAVQNRQKPMVFVGDDWGNFQGDYIRIDFHTGAVEALTHLIDSGCRRIVYVGASFGARRQAYEAVMEEAGQQPEFVITSEDSRSGGYQGMLDYLGGSVGLDGLFCCNDEMAIGCSAALAHRGMRVPEDVLVVGFDGLESARILPCPISSVVVPLGEICELAWDILRRRIQEPSSLPEQYTIVPRLEVRASSVRLV